MQLELFPGGSYTWIEPVKSAHELPDNAEEGMISLHLDENNPYQTFCFYRTQTEWIRVLFSQNILMPNPVD